MSKKTFYGQQFYLRANFLPIDKAIRQRTTTDILRIVVLENKKVAFPEAIMVLEPVYLKLGFHLYRLPRN